MHSEHNAFTAQIRYKVPISVLNDTCKSTIHWLIASLAILLPVINALHTEAHRDVVGHCEYCGLIGQAIFMLLVLMVFVVIEW